MKWLTKDRLIPIYIVGVIGAFLQIAGAQWDVSAHTLGIVETFFTPAHTVLYAGIALVAVASISGLLLDSRITRAELSPAFQNGAKIAVVGSSLQVIAAPIDFWWHSTYGFDPFLFTPAHSILIIGMIIGGLGMLFGSLRLFRAKQSGRRLPGSPRLIRLVPATVIMGLSAVWVQLNFFGYWITDITGLAYTFGYCTIPQFRALQCSVLDSGPLSLVSFLIATGIFAAAGTMIFWTTKGLFHRRGVFTGIATIVAAVYTFTALGFTAYELSFQSPPGSWYITNVSPNQGTILALFIPIYLLSLIPATFLDFLTRDAITKNRLLLLSAITGPFLAFIDARFSHGVSTSNLDTMGLAILLAPLILGGLGGLTLLNRISHEIIPRLATATRLNPKGQNVEKLLRP